MRVLEKEVSVKTILLVIALAGVASDAYAQDAASGEKVFAQCRACHQVGPNAKNAIGPVLNGLIGRKAGTHEGYTYSQAMKDSGITWTDDSFSTYIMNPRAKVPGTKMAFAGVKDPGKVADLLAYLKQFDANGNKVP